MGNPEFLQENETHKHIWDFEIQTVLLITTRQPDQVIVNKNKRERICGIADFAEPPDNSDKLKESEQRYKYLDITREIKKQKLWNMKAKVIPIVISALSTVTNGLIQ